MFFDTPRRHVVVLVKVALSAVVGMSVVGCGQSAVSGAPTPSSVVHGRVTAGPSCPVEPVDDPCPLQPVVGEIQARRPDGSTVATARSQPDGTYRIALPKGTYTLVVALPTQFPLCTPTQVTVAGPSTLADITCDTGIR